MVIDIKLDKDDDAQRIFESLNSTGLELSEGDKIRNFILMGLDPDIQEEYYENYWNKIEKNTNYDVSSFCTRLVSRNPKEKPQLSKKYTLYLRTMSEIVK